MRRPRRHKELLRKCVSNSSLYLHLFSGTIKVPLCKIDEENNLNNTQIKFKQKLSKSIKKKMRYQKKTKQNFMLSLLFIISNVNAIYSDSATYRHTYDLTTNYPPQPYEEQQATRCQPVDSQFCNLPSYSTVHPFHNSLGHTTPADALASLHKHLYLISNDDCRDKLQLFLCALYVPVCVNSTFVEGILYPCKDDCIAAKDVCKRYYLGYLSSWPSEWDCEKFKFHSEDPLCVIDNNRINRTLDVTGSPTSTLIPPILIPPEVPTKPEELPNLDLGAPPSNETVCDKDLFDCQLRDPTKNLGAYCIEQSYVCNGIEDCIRNGTLEGLHGMDEKNCPNKCTEYQLNCDNKCYSRSDICDGKVDCSSGIDEQGCYNYLTDYIQFILFIFSIFAMVKAIMIFVRCIKVNGEDNDIYDDKPRRLDIDAVHHHDNLRYDSPSITPHSGPEDRPCTPIHHEPHVFDNVVSMSLNNDLHYNDPVYSTVSRTEFYERVAIGGRSGASSVYTSYQSPPRSLIDIGRHSLTPQDCISRPPQDTVPPPPPPTPAPTPLYANITT